MAPIYFGRIPPKANASNNMSIVPGTGLMPSAPSEAHIFGTTSTWLNTDEDAFKHIPEVYASAFYKANIAINQSFSSFLLTSEAINAFTPPNLCITYKTKSGPPETSLVRLNEIGFTTMEQKGKVYYMFESPSIAHLRIIAESKPNNDGWSPSNYVNLNAMRQHHIIGIVLRQAYAVVSGRHLIRKKYGRFGILRPAVIENKQIKGHNVDTGELIAYSFDTDPKNMIDTIKYDFDSASPDGVVVPYIEDAIELKPRFYQGKADLWGTNGFFFPYHRNLCLADIAVIPDLMEQHLFGFLGTSAQAQAKSFKAITTAWGALCHTQWGHEVAHFARCMSIAIKTGSRICAINLLKQGYTGCVLSNGALTIHSYGEIHSPLPLKKVQQEINEHALKSSSLTKILEILNKKDHGNTDWTKKKFSHIRELAQVMNTIGLTEADKEEIMELTSKVSFPNERPWTPSFMNIVKAVRMLQNQDPIDQKLPMHFSVIFSVNRIELVWSVFGHMAPTFNLPGGNKHKLALAVPTDQGRTRFSIRLVPLNIAVKDLETIKSSKSVLNFPLPTYVRISDKGLGVKERDELWVELRKFVGETEQSVAPIPSVVEKPISGEMEPEDMY